MSLAREDTIAPVVSEVLDLATSRGWEKVGGLAALLLSRGDETQIVLAPAAGANCSALGAWIAGVSGASVVEAPIETICADPAPVLLASKLIAVFECGRLLDAAAVEIIQRYFVQRPAESFAIVMANAERLESAEELDLTERAVWRVLVPDPKPDWARQDLLMWQCYLWTAAEPREFLRGRRDRDREALAAVLNASGEGSDELARLRVFDLLDLAEEQLVPDLNDGRDGAAQPYGQDLFRISAARRKLAARLDMDARSASRQAEASALAAQRDLLNGLEPMLRSGFRREWKSPTGLREEQFRAALKSYLEAGLAGWGSDLQAALSARAAGILSESEEVLRSLDWTLVNQLRRTAGLAGEYPEFLFRPLAAGVNRVVAESPGGGPESPRWMGEAATVGALAGMAALSSGLLVSGLVAGILGPMVVYRQRKRSFEHFALRGRNAIRSLTRQASEDARTGIESAIQAYRDWIVAGLRDAEAMLEAARDEACQSPAAAALRADRERISELRRRL